MNKEKRIFFISGHRDLSPKEFRELYIPKINQVIDLYDAYFLIGEYEGADTMAQEYLVEIGYDCNKIQIFHMGKKPIYCNKRLTQCCVGGFADDIARDTAMTYNSDEDIAFVRYGRYGSGTGQNIIRRHEFLTKNGNTNLLIEK